MSELKAIRSGEIYNIIEYEDCNRTDDLYYPKSEVDAAITELKSENERLNRELEHVKNGDCINTCDVVEKHVKEEIKAKRALWLARAERAVAKQAYYDVLSRGISSERSEMYDAWNNIERKCLKKAEEYK